MKAEHRKELETNLLADRMGRMVQNIKSSQQKKKAILMVVGCLLVLAIVWFFMRKVQLARQVSSEHWQALEDGQATGALAGQFPESMQGKVARFHQANFLLWNSGVALLGADHHRDFAFSNINKAEVQYEALAKDCKGDPVLEPEARYALAVIEETQALRRVEALKSARELYKKVADEFPESAHGKAAKKRYDLLDDKEGEGANKTPRQQIEEFYRELRERWHVGEEFLKKKSAPPRKLPGEK